MNGLFTLTLQSIVKSLVQSVCATGINRRNYVNELNI